MPNKSSSFEPMHEEEWNYSTDENYIPLESNHLWRYQDSMTFHDEGLLPEEYLISEEASFSFAEEYVLYEGKYGLQWGEDALHRNVKQGKRMKNLGNDEVLSFPGEEN